MNLLYTGSYRERFNQVIKQIADLPTNSSILELCFGDIYIAEYCKRRGHAWRGIDLNKHFVKQAKQLGYDAHHDDLARLEKLPKASACIMMGSLYHFYPHTLSMLNKMANASDMIIISEPVSNLSSRKGLLGYVAKRAASVGKRQETFRYDTNSLMALVTESCDLLNYKIVLAERLGKDFIIKLIKKNGSN